MRAAGSATRLSRADPETSGAIVWDPHFNVVSWNSGAHALFGFASSEVAGRNAFDVLALTGSRTDIAELRHAIETRRAGIRVVSRVRTKDGRSVACEWYHAPVFDAAGVLEGFASAVAVARDADRSDERVALRDGLTGLPSVALLQDRVEHAMATGLREHTDVAVLAIDVDRAHDADVDETEGSNIREALLRDVAGRLTTSLRTADSLARREDGSFLALLTNVGGRLGVTAIAQRILSSFDEPFRVGSHRLDRSASVGIALFPEDGRDAKAMLRCADVAIRGAKQLGGSAFQCYGAAPGTAQRVSLEQDLRMSLERDELELHYQPQFDLRSGALCGVEALVRWRHPSRGLLYPSDFLTLAEEAGLIVPVGTWVLRSACEAMREWKDSGVAVPRITVNVSGGQFRRRFVDEVARALCDTDVDPAALELELTETVTVRSIEACPHLLDELKSFGVRLAIDDFGVGPSSIADLARMPIDSLKIDRHFVGDCMTNPSNAAIIQAVLTMAAGMDLEVVAEGVESLEQADFLRSLGCDAAQGFWFSPALRFGSIPGFIATR